MKTFKTTGFRKGELLDALHRAEFELMIADADYIEVVKRLDAIYTLILQMEN